LRPERRRAKGTRLAARSHAPVADKPSGVFSALFGLSAFAVDRAAFERGLERERIEEDINVLRNPA
jgi:hypothetical protein